LLHSQSAKQDFDAITVFILADLFNDKGMSRNCVMLNLSFQQSYAIGLLHRAAKRGSDRTRRRVCFQKFSH
jgi:hypothetical protein